MLREYEIGSDMEDKDDPTLVLNGNDNDRVEKEEINNVRLLLLLTFFTKTGNLIERSQKKRKMKLQNFCLCITDLYEREYLRKPTTHDIQRLYAPHEAKHGFRGILGSIDCRHWEWKTCVVAWQGQFTNGHKKLSLILEVNDTPPPATFTVNSREYTYSYYLTDGTYPDWATLIKAFSSPTDEPYTDVTQKMSRILYACVLLHNMIQEDNGFAITSLDEEYLRDPDNQPAFVRNQNSDHATRAREIRDRDVHNQLRTDLIEDIWNLPPNF
ncbi:uncharacterized protein [Rutidosis leptorrhynchoides]|uniref:uncharacterized protein n=1 Tax=Rutidosis leptorrhynchoides TaxID=125765 RepID=UPI003A9931A5